MSDFNTELLRANQSLSNEARDTIIEVEQERVIGGDPMENIRGRTVREVVTNHQLTVSDRLGMYKTPGWHGLGDVIEEGLSGRQAVERFIGWQVEQYPIYTRIGGEERLLPLKSNVRSDTNDLLGVVSDSYVLVQNHDIGDFADALLQESKESGIGVRMETCGSLLGGRKVFLTMRADKEIRVGRTGEDLTIPMLGIFTGHDGSMATTGAWVMNRVVCNNSYTSNLAQIEQDVGAGKAFRIQHKGKVAEYLTQAKLCLGLAVKGLEQYQTLATGMSQRKLSKEELRTFFVDSARAMMGSWSDRPKTEAEQKAKDKAEAMIAAWMGLMGDDTNLFDGIEGTLWAAFNCITHYQDHTRSNGSRMGAQDRRDHLKIIGQAAIDKRKAFRLATRLLAA